MNYPLYIHIPYCLSKCDYCDFFSVPIGGATGEHAVRDGGRRGVHVGGCRKKITGGTHGFSGRVPDEYVSALCNEISYRKEKYNAENWSTIYIGGGTPSLLSPCQIKRIAECALKNSTQTLEFTVEANPADISFDFLKCLSDCGVNRLSLGVQAFDDDALSCVKRRSTARDVEKSLELVKKQWRGAFSADLISALPFQTEKSFIQGVKRLLEYEPHHISLYSLTIEEGTPLFKRIDSKEIPYNYDEADALWLLGKETLERNGWCAYEISNFYHKENGSPCAHNMAYWKMHSYIGAGSGGTGSVYGETAMRYTNTCDIAKYIDFWSHWKDDRKGGGTGEASSAKSGADGVNAEKSGADGACVLAKSEILLPEEREFLKQSDEEIEFFMMGLRLYEGICLEDFERRFSKAIPSEYYAVMDSWRKNGRAEYYKKSGRQWFCLTRKGILFLNGFMKELVSCK